MEIFDDPMLKSTIDYWESILLHDRYLLEPSVKTFVEHTIKYLKELLKIRESRND